jgi:type II secretory pathway pseudopilin PulG
VVKSRLAFTMIELIFAIVVVSFVVLSLPMVTQVTSQNTQDSYVQEAIFASSAQLSEVTAYRWDEASLDTDTFLSRVLSTNNDACDATTKLRTGHIAQPYHRRCVEDTTDRPSSIGFDGTENAADFDDLDDLDGTTAALYLAYSASAKGYKNDYNSTVSISYSDFGNETVANQDIKRIRVQIFQNNNLITQLDSFAANIGEIDYFKRSY